MSPKPLPGTLPKAAIMQLLREQMLAFNEARRLGDEGAAWRALEWEHILSQPYMAAHLASHWRMLGYALSLGKGKEAAGQAVRLLLVPLGALTGRLPVGNNGRAGVSAFEPMPIPGALAARIEQARAEAAS